MKKVLLVSLLFVCMISFTGCFKKEFTDYTQLSYNDLQKKIENKDSFVLVLGSSTCSACAKYKETMKSIIKEYQVEIFYIDLKSLSNEEYAKVYSKFVITSTPTTIFIIDGKEKTTYDRIVGAAEYNDVVNKLKRHGVIGE